MSTFNLDALKRRRPIRNDAGVETSLVQLTIEERDALIQRLREAEAALAKINDIRNSIVGYQTFNWSAHIYPLVAALEEAGIHGEGYDVAHAKAVTQVERIARLERVREAAKDRTHYGDGYASGGDKFAVRHESGCSFCAALAAVEEK